MHTYQKGLINSDKESIIIWGNAGDKSRWTHFPTPRPSRPKLIKHKNYVQLQNQKTLEVSEITM